MSSVTNNLIDTGVRLSRFIPAPKSHSQSNFGDVVRGLGGLAKTAFNTVSSSVPGAVDSVYQDFLNQQVMHQEQMLYVSLASNVEKVAHDTKMSAVRNIRAN